MQIGEEEAALVEAWRRGDPEAVRQVVALHGAALLRVALAICPQAEDAEEVVQDAMLRAHRSIASFDADRGSLRGWLVGVTVNRARQVRRGHARYGSFLARFRREPYVPGSPAATHGDLDFARRRLAEIPAREREAFVLVDIEELTSAEAARAMGVSGSTVRVLLGRARRRLEETAAVSPVRSLRVEGTGK